MRLHYLGRAGQVGRDLKTGMGPHSPPKTSPNLSGRGVVVALTHVSTTISGLSMPPVSLQVFPGGGTNQYPISSKETSDIRRISTTKDSHNDLVRVRVMF